MARVQEQKSVASVETAARTGCDRRSFLGVGAAAAAATTLAPSAFALTQRFPLGPEPIRYPSGVWKVLDDRFRKYIIGNTPLVRV